MTTPPQTCPKCGKAIPNYDTREPYCHCTRLSEPAKCLTCLDTGCLNGGHIGEYEPCPCTMKPEPPSAYEKQLAQEVQKLEKENASLFDQLKWSFKKEIQLEEQLFTQHDFDKKEIQRLTTEFYQCKGALRATSREAKELEKENIRLQNVQHILERIVEAITYTEQGVVNGVRRRVMTKVLAEYEQFKLK